MKRPLTEALLSACLILVAAMLMQAGRDGGDVPRYEIDPSWPKPLPDGWITGRLGGVCVDAQDHVIITNRRDITAEEAETSKQAPSIIVFGVDGSVVASWGDTTTVPGTIHGCFVDRDQNIWITGSGDGILQKYSHDGRLLLQIGKKGIVDSTDGTAKGRALNSSHTQFFNPGGVAVDPTNGDAYIADGYGNHRIAVFDRSGQFLRQWGRQATEDEVRSGAGGAFAHVVHCVAISNAGLVYVCDRHGDRVQVFDKQGNFQKNIWIKTGAATLPDPRGTVWSLAFSPDQSQSFMYVMNGRNEVVHILDHSSGKILSDFGRPGHQLGNFTHGHSLAVDSKGNIYVAETDWGRRIQKFRVVQ